MHRANVPAVTTGLCFLCTGLLAQAPANRKPPTEVPDGAAPLLGLKMRYSKSNRMSDSGKAAARQQRIVSVPTWSSSFAYQGQVYPYTMVGDDPRRGKTTSIDTSIIPLSFVFDGYVDQNGNNIVLDVSPIVPKTLQSPNWVRSGYSTGFVQFGDAVQRAEFWKIADSDWHTVIDQPRKLTPVTIEVPPGSAYLFITKSGVIFALMDENFFISQLNTIVQLEDMRVGELAIALSSNVLLYEGDPSNCCVLGFHTAYEAGSSQNKIAVQTLAWASWVDAAIYGDNEVADILPLSHEISEWMNDPFINNLVPVWQFPGAQGCQADLETGDPIEAFAHPSYPVTLHGYTYHPQTEALFSWFARQTPSIGIGGAYSYPNTSLLTAPSQPCTNP